MIEARVSLLPPDVGGRIDGLRASDGAYRPHVIVAGTADYLGVAFLVPETIEPGHTASVTLACLYRPDVDYRALQENVQFIVVEGRRIVAVGRVLRVLGDGRSDQITG